MAPPRCAVAYSRAEHMRGARRPTSIPWLGRRAWSRVVVAFVVATGAISCGGSSRYTDGPLTGYSKQPIPKLERPLARTLSLELVAYNTASSDKALMVSDHVGRDLYILPGDVGEEVGRFCARVCELRSTRGCDRQRGDGHDRSVPDDEPVDDGQDRTRRFSCSRARSSDHPA